MKEFLSVGQIINTHGINGELKIYPLTDDIRRFQRLKKVYIDGEVKNIVWCKLQSDKVILKIDGVESIEDAMKLRGKYLDVTREDAVKLPEGNYFIADIIGCNVLDEDGLNFGKVYDVIKTGSNDVYWVKKTGDELLVPALKSVVVKMDIENKNIIIKPLNIWYED